MKKTLIALMSLACVAHAGQVLTLTGLTDNALTSGTYTFDWIEVTGNLTSWEVSFDIVVTANQENQSYAKNGSIFYTNGGDDNGDITLDFWNGYLQLNQKNVATVIDSKDVSDCLLSAGESASVTITMIATKKDGEVTEYNGALTVTPQTGASYTGTYTKDDYFSGPLFHDGSWAKLVTNGAVTFSNISLTMLEDKLAPEPTTATLSLLALCGLAARRRRR